MVLEHCKKHSLNTILFLLLTLLGVGSNNKLLLAEKKLNEFKINDAKNILSNINPDGLDKNNSAYYNFLMGDLHDKLNNADVAFRYLLSAKQQYRKLDSVNRLMDINLKLSSLLLGQENNFSNANRYLTEYMQQATAQKDTLRLVRGYIAMAGAKISEEKYRESIKLYKKALRLNKQTGAANFDIVINNNMANLYNEVLDKPDSALYYLNINLEKIDNYRGNKTENYYHNYLNHAASYYYKQNYTTANLFLKKADSLPLKEYIVKSKQYIYEGFYMNYEALGDFKNAYKYLQLARTYADSANVEKQNIAINDIQTKYQTKEKELENQLLKGNIKTNRILLYTFIVLLTASLAIGWLIVKNARRREKISVQEKQIERQKLEKALKDFELSSIDLMLEGQEQERQRIANDLHDNLGSMLATLKINFENLKIRNANSTGTDAALYEKTDDLIEEAYHKVRRLAHTKNAGVFANQGLIPAVKKLAEKVSVPGKFEVEVLEYGFNERLDNKLEFTIFRAVQELITNILKHAHATEASVQLTQHDDNINIIIEDNGVGFHSDKPNSNGMGLQAIQKKMRQLTGKLEIDSTPNKGTTIIIDIPV